MSTLQIRDLPEELYDLLKKSAAKSRRSMTQEAIVLLEEILMKKEGNLERRQRIIKDVSNTRKLTKEEGDLAIDWIREDRERQW